MARPCRGRGSTKGSSNIGYCAAILLGFAAVLAGTLPAAATLVDENELISRLTADDVVVALTFADADRLERTTDSQGNPKVVGEFSRLKFAVAFRDCTSAGCAWCRFQTYVTRPDMSRTEKLAFVNDWNSRWPFGSAFITGRGNLALDQPFIAAGGVSRGNLQHAADQWIIALTRFTLRLGPRRQ